jgi:hypothetical protein
LARRPDRPTLIPNALALQDLLPHAWRMGALTIADISHFFGKHIRYWWD